MKKINRPFKLQYRRASGLNTKPPCLFLNLPPSPAKEPSRRLYTTTSPTFSPSPLVLVRKGGVDTDPDAKKTTKSKNGKMNRNE